MITDKVEMRELFELNGGGVLLRGTFHKATGGNVTQSGNPDPTIGVMFLNPMATPRSLTGDLGVYLADSFAALGYPSFRCDLPGSGDSPGEVPLDFLEFINKGGYAKVVVSKIKELTQRFNLSGIIIYGHCAAATTAIYVASECSECKGLILTDPYFNAVNNLTQKLRPEMLAWARRSKIGEMLRASHFRFREAWRRRGQGSLPGNANLGLLSHWKKVLSHGTPILVFRSSERRGNSKLRAGAFDYLAYISSLATCSGQLTAKTVEDTDHSFANQSGRTAIRSCAESWLDQGFSLAKTGDPALQAKGRQSIEMDSLTLEKAFSVGVVPGD